MKKILPLLLLITSVNALAFPLLIPERCAHDSLNQWNEGEALLNTSRGRNEWLKICRPETYEAFFQDGNEYMENLPDRRVYPTYAVITGRGTKNEVLFATDGYVAPSTPPLVSTDPSCVIPRKNKLVGICVSGCVTADTEVVSASGNLEISKLAQLTDQEVSVPQFANGEFNTTPFKVKSFIKDMMSVEQKILKITTKSKGVIKVSKNHPLLNGDHLMMPAEKLHIGESLVLENGKNDEIVAIEEVSYFGKLHNLTVNSTKLDESLFVAQGFISGDKKFQDIEVSEMNREIFRQTTFENIKK